MVKQLLLLFFLFFIAWTFPPLFGVAGLSLMGVLLAQDVPSIVLVLVIALGTLASYLPVWYIISEVQKRIQKRRERREKRKEDLLLEKPKQGVWRRSIAYVTDRVHKAHDSKEFKRFSSFMDSKTGKYVTFAAAVILCSPLGSNFIAVLILRKRMSKKQIFSAGLVGETVGAFAFVYGGFFINHLIRLWIK